MIQLTDLRATKKIVLPTYDVEVEIYTELLTGEVNSIRKKFENDDDRGLETIRLHIKSWPFVDSNEKELPVTLENLNKLPMSDTLALLNGIGAVEVDEEGKKKKNSNE